jgi:hypothetical protein
MIATKEQVLKEEENILSLKVKTVERWFSLKRNAI